MNTTPLHHRMAEKVMEMLRQGAHRESNQEQVQNGMLIQVRNATKSFQLNGEIFISSADIYDGLTGNAIKLVIQIQRELVMNNPLWEFTTKENQRDRSAVALLKRRGILELIPGTDMYIVNPAKIRKGRPLSIYGALYDYARRQYQKDKNWRPTTEAILKFKAPDNIVLPDDLELYLQG